MIKKLAVIFSILGTYGTPTLAQDFYQDLAIGMAKEGISQAETALNELPAMLEGGLKIAQAGHEFESQEFCRGSVQAIVNMGVVLSNMMPFTKVWTYEDERGPVGKLRIMLNGQQIHTEVYCDDMTLKSAELPWGEGDRTPEEVNMTSLAAMLGFGLNLQLQGVFDQSELSQNGAADSSNIDPSSLLPPKPTSLKEAIEAELSGTDAPPMTGSERDAFRLAVNSCWNVDAGADAARVTVEVGFSLDREGKVTGDVRLLSSDGDQSATAEAFEAAKRAVLRCQMGGYQLPAEKYDQWQEAVITFDPSGIRLR